MNASHCAICYGEYSPLSPCENSESQAILLKRFVRQLVSRDLSNKLEGGHTVSTQGNLLCPQCAAILSKCSSLKLKQECFQMELNHELSLLKAQLEIGNLYAEHNFYESIVKECKYDENVLNCRQKIYDVCRHAVTTKAPVVSLERFPIFGMEFGLQSRGLETDTVIAHALHELPGETLLQSDANESMNRIEKLEVSNEIEIDKAITVKTPAEQPAPCIPKQQKSSTKKPSTRKKVVIPDHVTVTEIDNITRYSCNICPTSKSFKTKHQVTYHQTCNTIDPQAGSPHKCQECGKGFKTKTHLGYHKLVHLGQKPFKCPECGKGFRQKAKVNRHMLTHTGEKPYICCIKNCHKRFTTACNLKYHVEGHLGDKKYSCKECGKVYQGASGLRKHVASIHSKERPFSCETSSKSFPLKHLLDEHLKRHIKGEKFECTVCFKQLSSNHALKRHSVTVHAKNQKFVCSICSKKFCRNDNLNRHINNVHNNAMVDKQLAQTAVEVPAQDTTMQSILLEYVSDTGTCYYVAA